MSIQHSEFAMNKAEFIGSPSDAAGIVSARSAAIRRIDAADVAFVRFPSLDFVNPAQVDPAMVPADLRISVRVSPAVEARISAIARKMGFTFWGQAVALVLGAVLENRRFFDVTALRNGAPAGLLKSRGKLKQGATLAPALVKRIQSPVTPQTMDLLKWLADRQGFSVPAIAALILHRHAAIIAAMVCR